MDQIAIVPLGISAGAPTAERHLSALAVVMDGRVVLFDCGEGTQYQLMRAPFRWSRIEAIFVTHLHGDHAYGLPGLLGTLSLNGHDAPLAVYGPPGIRDYLEGVIATTRLHLTFPLTIEEVGEGDVCRARGYTVSARLLDHCVPAFGYALVEDDHPGAFDLEAARRLGIPEGPLYGRLKRGEAVDLADGRRIHPDKVLGPARPGRKVVYCLDTRPCQAGIDLARGATVLIHEATYGQEHAVDARERSHSTAVEAAGVGRAAGVSRLLLTHISPRYLDPEVLAVEAREIFEATDVCRELAMIRVEGVPGVQGVQGEP